MFNKNTKHSNLKRSIQTTFMNRIKCIQSYNRHKVYYLPKVCSYVILFVAKIEIILLFKSYLCFKNKQKLRHAVTSMVCVIHSWLVLSAYTNHATEVENLWKLAQLWIYCILKWILVRYVFFMFRFCSCNGFYTLCIMHISDKNKTKV